MFLNLINWVWIFIFATAAGVGVARILPGDIYKRKELDVYVALGTLALTVYAETWSIFYRVGLLCTMVLLVASAIIFVAFGKSLASDIKGFSVKGSSVIKILITLFFFVFFLVAASSRPHADDDYGYHLQAIEWINRYGVIKGQGILHFRFGYNSAFLSLQALFSWKSMTGFALHGVNAFYAFVLCAYCICSLEITFSGLMKEIKGSDVLKIFTCIYLLIQYRTMIGVETDELVCMAVLYIFIKWFEYEEKQDKSLDSRAVLAILAVWAVTLKVSVAPMGLFVIFVLIGYIREKRYKDIALYTVLSLAIVVPYLVRSVIISGYLLYPATSIDLFNVDWKIPKDIVDVDRWGITIWGRKLQNLIIENGMSYEEVFDMPITVWLPSWLKGIDAVSRCFFGATVLLTIDGVIAIIRRFSSSWKESISELVPLFVAFCSVLFWFFNAPLIRYGSFLMPLFIVVELVIFHKSIARWMVYICGVICPIAAIAMIVLGKIKMKPGIVFPRDYKHNEMVGTETGFTDRAGNEIILYAPAEGGHCDPDYFPATNAQVHIDHLQFRGEFLEDGFKYLDD